MNTENPESISEKMADPMRCSDCGKSHVLDYAENMPGLPEGSYFIPGYKHCDCGSDLFGFLSNLPLPQVKALSQACVEYLYERDVPEFAPKVKRWGKKRHH